MPVFDGLCGRGPTTPQGQVLLAVLRPAGFGARRVLGSKALFARLSNGQAASSRSVSRAKRKPMTHCTPGDKPRTGGPGLRAALIGVTALMCLLFFPMAADANDTAIFNAMVALANKGDAEAQYHVGMMYNNGIGTQRDFKQAFEWFQKSTASNHPLGAYKLGCYYDGQGEGVVTADANEALKYKLIAAEAGYSLAQHDVALLYARRENFEEAMKWWKLSGDQGHPRSLYNLSSLYF